MNGLKSKVSDKVGSPYAKSPNQENVRPKNNRNKLNGKDDKVENIDNSDSPLPRLEVLDTPSSAFKPSCQQNGFHSKRPKIENDEDESIDRMACHLPQQEVQDDCETFGQYVTAQLRQMTQMQKFLAQRLISEVCFRGQIQVLQINTGFNDYSPVFHQQQLSVPVYTARPGHFNRGSEFHISHQQNIIRHQPHMSPGNANATVAAAAGAFQYQNFLNMQQPDHV